MTETTATLPDPEMTAVTYLGTKRPKKYAEMTYLEKNNIDGAILQKLREKDVYK